MPPCVVGPLTDQGLIRSFLMRDPDYAAYAIGDLEPPHNRYASWFAAARGGEIDGLALLYRGLEPPVLFLMGSSPAVAALLNYGIGPPQVLFLIRSTMEAVIGAYYRIEYAYQMHRMCLTADTLKTGSDTGVPQVKPLGHAHVDAILELVRLASQHDERADSDVAFDPTMVSDGFYRGVFSSGALVAVAGTHLVAQQARLAALGNVVVHPAHRGKGLGTQVSRAVTQALLASGVERIVLNVRQDNAPAIRIYKRLGFWFARPFIECLASRRPQLDGA